MNNVQVVIIPMVREKQGKSEYSHPHTYIELKEIYALGEKYKQAITELGINCKYDDSVASSEFKQREYEYQKIPVFVLVHLYRHHNFNPGLSAIVQTLEMRLEKDWTRIPRGCFEENLAMIKTICERQIISNNIIIIKEKSK